MREGIDFEKIVLRNTRLKFHKLTRISERLASEKFITRIIMLRMI